MATSSQPVTHVYIAVKLPEGATYGDLGDVLERYIGFSASTHNDRITVTVGDGNAHRAAPTEVPSVIWAVQSE